MYQVHKIQRCLVFVHGTISEFIISLLCHYLLMQGSFFASSRVKGEATYAFNLHLEVVMAEHLCFPFSRFGPDRPFIPKQPKPDGENRPQKGRKPSSKAAKAKAKSKAKAKVEKPSPGKQKKK